ncbi:metallophosphoesterase [Gilvimarinus agarilyticus]|uniref:metallophosphoesterase n=1 Tax=Gilvimarinus sp. 2_MG-2023 TaxID=3062666 RepID=UPI001C08121E|nr:metallophosphoesterase [Gilvimarinus sp. 2_MG-2023]MBU2887147.1 metallophosphoesterase [Gilvimarinus agarilyticus]MDO6571806.1 metallophosphoesterase [Gilvimarinus sp. 2_MG-2023]
MSDLQATEELNVKASQLDIIGDVHGCANTLQRLLQKLDYQKVAGVYRNPQRKVVFVGDIVDRGPRIREALAIVRDMVDAGEATMVLGNHELHALCYCLPNPNIPNHYLRPHTPRNTSIIQETLEQFANHSQDWQDHLRWLKQRPLYFQMPGVRVIHACWDQSVINRLAAVIPEARWSELADPASQLSRDVKRLTSGVELPLPEPHIMLSAEGYRRRSFRAGFWQSNPVNLGALAFQPDPLPDSVAALPVTDDIKAQLVVYDSSQPPLFVGHYWLNGSPKPITENIACLDYSAVKFGRLVAYRCDGRQTLHPNQYNWVYVDP